MEGGGVWVSSCMSDNKSFLSREEKRVLVLSYRLWKKCELNIDDFFDHMKNHGLRVSPHSMSRWDNRSDEDGWLPLTEETRGRKSSLNGENEKFMLGWDTHFFFSMSSFRHLYRCLECAHLLQYYLTILIFRYCFNELREWYLLHPSQLQASAFLWLSQSLSTEHWRKWLISHGFTLQNAASKEEKGYTFLASGGVDITRVWLQENLALILRTPPDRLYSMDFTYSTERRVTKRGYGPKG